MKYIALFILILLCVVILYVRPLLGIGAGYAAKMACSCHYLQGRSLADIQQHDLNFSGMQYVQLRHDEEKKEVSASFGVVTKKARFVEGRGCVLLADEDAPMPRSWLRKTSPIVNWPTYDTLPIGIDTLALSRAMNQAFEPVEGGGTRAVVVIHDGRLLMEQYAEGFGPQKRQIGWSMTKSVINALVGLLVKKGDLTIEQNHLFPEWTDERANITLGSLLQMNSGLKWDENYSRASNVTRMLYEEPNMAAYALETKATVSPGDEWLYSSGTTNLLSLLVRQTVGSDDAYQSLLMNSLFGQIGMSSAILEPDQSGTLIGSSYCWATPRDWARFGQLYLQGGQWNGEEILSKDWIDYSCQKASGSEGTYGAQLWHPTEELGEVPSDLFLFRGYQDQRVFMIPSRKCVIVRMGKNKDKVFDLGTFLRSILSALPE